MRGGALSAALVGALLGVVVVVAIVAAAILGVFPGASAREDVAADSPVLAALVLPDAEGILTVRAIDRYQRAGDVLRISAVDPLTSATVPGTSGATLADAYAFGGGEGLVSAYSRVAPGEAPAWIVVGPKAWVELMGTTTVSLLLGSDIEVFDGEELYSFPAGRLNVPAREIAPVMTGAQFSSASERKDIREAVGDELASALLRGYEAQRTGIETNLTPEQLQLRLSGLKSLPIRADKNP